MNYTDIVILQNLSEPEKRWPLIPREPSNFEYAEYCWTTDHYSVCPYSSLYVRTNICNGSNLYVCDSIEVIALILFSKSYVIY